MNIMKVLYECSNWLAKVMYLHILWVVFTLAGLVVFGITPATMALCSVVHKWYDKDFDLPIFKHFYAAYKAQFKKSNILGLLLMGVGLFLYIDLKISEELIQSFYLHAVILFICFVYLITIIYMFTIFVRYELPLLTYFKQSLFIALARPMETIAIMLSLFILYFLFSFVPVLFIFAGSSIVFTPLVWFSYRACLLVEEKKLHVLNNTISHTK